MDKNKNIIGSLEEWDSILDYYRPNGSSKTWYLKELKKVRIPTMWGDWNLFTEDGDIFDKNAIENTVIPPYFNNIINFLPIEEVNNINHIYLINIYAPSFFEDNYKVGFSCISEKYKKDIRDGRCKLVLSLIHEGYSGSNGNRDIDVIEEWRIKENFPIGSVYYISGNLIVDKISISKKLGIILIPMQMFESWIWGDDQKNNDPPVTFTPVDDKYLYLSYNRQPRLHRLYFVHELIRLNLINNGLVSLNTPWSDCVHYNFPNKNKVIFDFMLNNSPFQINENYDFKYNLACNLDIEDYKRTFISVISETLTNRNCLFLSEKIWKPIVIGHPFMVFGNKGTLKYLKELGYKTFSDWIDESYDEEEDNLKRCDMIINELKKFQKYNIKELKSMREEMYSICKYNKNHFINLFELNYKDRTSMVLDKHIQDIWKDFNKIKLI